MKKSELSENQNPEPVKGKNKTNNRKRLPASLRAFVSLSVCAATVLTVSGGLKIGRTESMRQQTAQEAVFMKVRIMICHQGSQVWLPA